MKIPLLVWRVYVFCPLVCVSGLGLESLMKGRAKSPFGAKQNDSENHA